MVKIISRERKFHKGEEVVELKLGASPVQVTSDLTGCTFQVESFSLVAAKQSNPILNVPDGGEYSGQILVLQEEYEEDLDESLTYHLNYFVVFGYVPEGSLVPISATKVKHMIRYQGITM